MKSALTYDATSKYFSFKLGKRQYCQRSSLDNTEK